jgi:hypothetical protein
MRYILAMLLVVDLKSGKQWIREYNSCAMIVRFWQIGE